MRSALAVIAVLLCLNCLAARHAAADGYMMSMSDFGADHRPVEREQMAAISFKDGRQTMILAVRADLATGRKALWIFPVPGTPQTTRLDIVNGFPRLDGMEVGARAVSDMWWTMLLVRSTQLWPLIVDVPRLLVAGGIGDHDSVAIDKFGLHSELMAPRSEEELARILRERGLRPTATELAAYRAYVGKGYTLVATWVTAPAAPTLTDGRTRRLPDPMEGVRPSVAVEFATPRAFFPLRPTSIYGSLAVKARLLVVGAVEPVTTARVLGKHSTFCFLGSAYNDAGVTLPGAAPGRDIVYTRVKLDCPASAYTDDLWFRPTRDKRSERAVRFNRMLDAGGVLGLLGATLVLSYVCAGTAGLLVFRRWRGYALVGLLNILPLVGLVTVPRAVTAVFQRQNGAAEIGERAERFTAAFGLLLLIATIALEVTTRYLLAPPVRPGY